VTSALDANTDVYGGKGVLSSDKYGLVHLQTKDFWSDEVDGGPIDADKPMALFCVSDSCCSLRNVGLSFQLDQIRRK
jgi:hypothetical protein